MGCAAGMLALPDSAGDQSQIYALTNPPPSTPETHSNNGPSVPVQLLGMDLFHSAEG